MYTFKGTSSALLFIYIIVLPLIYIYILINELIFCYIKHIVCVNLERLDDEQIVRFCDVELYIRSLL